MSDLIAHCMSQNFPNIYEEFLIKHNQWHIFKIELTLDKNTQNYFVKWYIDDVLVHKKLLEYGLDFLFRVHCSLENIEFIGDHLPKQEYSTLFDYFKYEPLK